MYLSCDWTLIKLYREAAQDIKGAMSIPSYIWKDLVNRAIQTIAGQFYDLMAQSYMTDVVVNDATGSRYDAGTGGTYTASTRLVTLNSPSTNLSSGDIGKFVVFRIATSIYFGKVFSVPSTSTFVFEGDLYPLSNGAIVNNTLAIISTGVLNDTISLSSLRIMRTGQNITLDIASTATATIKTVSQRELDTFRTGGQNAKTIVWSLSGDNINLKKGDDLTSYGGLLIRYPRIPYRSILDNDGIDLPDGSAIEIAIIYLRGLIQRRLGNAPDNNEALMQQHIDSLYKTFGQQASTAVVKEKAIALKG